MATFTVAVFCTWRKLGANKQIVTDQERVAMRIVMLCFAIGCSVVSLSARELHRTSYAVQDLWAASADGTVVLAPTQIDNSEQIIRMVPTTGQLMPVTQATARINGIADQPNQLHNAAIAALAYVGPHLYVLTTRTDPSVAWLLNYAVDPKSSALIASTSLRDAVGTPGAQITLLRAAPTSYALAAVTDSAQHQWGVGNSGIAVISQFADQSKDQTLPATTKFAQVNQNSAVNDAVCALSLNVTSPILVDNGPLAECAINDMYWDANLKMLYIALRVRTGDNAQSVARSLILGQFDNHQLTLKRFIAPELSSHVLDSIVTVKGAQQSLSIDKVRTMRTSTHLDYAILISCVGASNSQRIYALALTNEPIGAKRGDEHGMLARTDKRPELYYKLSKPPVFTSRSFVQCAKSAEQVPSVDDDAIAVGGGQPLNGTITDMAVVSDAIFVSVAHAPDAQDNGIFYSQALLSQQGAIRAWTRWERAHPLRAGIQYLAANITDGSLTFAAQQDQKLTVHRTSWHAPDTTAFAPLFEPYARLLPSQQGGICMLKEISLSSDNRSGLLVAGGNQRLVLTLFDETQLSQLRTIPSDDNASKQAVPHMLFADEGLAQIGMITHAAPISLPDGTGLCIAGTQGIALLVDGSQKPFSLQEYKKTLSAQAHFKKMGDYSFVRALISDGDQLYVLTADKLERVCLTPQGACAHRLIGLQSLETFGSLNDIFIKGPLTVVATSTGLYQLKSPGDVRVITKEADMVWDRIALGTWRTASRLYSVCAQSKSDDTARVPAGMLYALCTDYTERSQVFRLTINPATRDCAPNVSLLDDLSTEHQRTAFLSMSAASDWFATDGALRLNVHSYGAAKAAELVNRSSGPVVAATLMERMSVTALSRCSLLGCWLLATHDGVLVVE